MSRVRRWAKATANRIRWRLEDRGGIWLQWLVWAWAVVGWVILVPLALFSSGN